MYLHALRVFPKLFTYLGHVYIYAAVFTYTYSYLYLCIVIYVSTDILLSIVMHTHNYDLFVMATFLTGLPHSYIFIYIHIPYIHAYKQAIRLTIIVT
jgi:hypothetical protein